MATATATDRSLRRAVAQPAEELGDARPDLRVVEDVVDESPRRSMAGLTGTVAVVLLFACVFGVVVFQVLLVQTQSKLDDLDATRTEQEARAKALDLETATLESPERIMAAANGLGMVPPDDVVYLEPHDSDDTDAIYDPATEPVGTTPSTVAPSATGTTPATTTATGTTPTTAGVTLAPGPPYTAENNWGAGGPSTLPPVYNAENDWGAAPTTVPVGGR